MRDGACQATTAEITFFGKAANLLQATLNLLSPSAPSLATHPTMANASNTGSGGFSLPSINFGNNLIEIGALTTLIGSTIAETLMFGNRGAAGLVWGMMSVFGNTSIIRACVNGATPGWARALLGLRNEASDAAVGLCLELSRASKAATKVRATLDVPLGVACVADVFEDYEDRAVDDSMPLLSKEHPSCRDIYAFDRSTTIMLDALPKTHPGEAMRVYTYGSYRYWIHGASLLALVSALPFAFFFFAACIIEVNEIILGRKPAEVGNLDAIAGMLPTTKRPGGEKKIALGVMVNPRSSIWWKLMWTIGAFIYTSSLITTYFLLNQESTPFVMVWAAFQVTWLILRILMYYLADTMEPMADRMMVGHQWKDLDTSMKTRVANLTLAVAKYQTQVHPRDFEVYGDDSFSSRQLTHFLASPNKLHPEYPLPTSLVRPQSSTFQVDVVAVVGDTALSSAAWMVGSKLSAMDLYDSCIIVFSLPSTPLQPLNHASSYRRTSSTIAIPAARVLSGTPPIFQAPDPEKRAPLFVPRGAGSRRDHKRTWWYWVPCGPGLWLQIKTENLTVLGKRTAEVLNDAQLSVLLGAGNLNICLTCADEVSEIVKTSWIAAEDLVSLLC